MHVAVVVDQHVGWLDVAVDHQVPVRIGDSAADLQVQAHDRMRVQGLVVTPAVDAHALDPRPRQRAGAVAGHARVDPGGDVVMVDAGTDRGRSEVHSSELPSLWRISYDVFYLIKTPTSH